MRLMYKIAASLLPIAIAGCSTQTPLSLESKLQALPESELSFLFGEWVGEASGIGPDGQPFELTQTERVGPMLAGSITVIEGQGYDVSGDAKFNALAIISKDPISKDWEIRSYSDGRAGTFQFEITDLGFEWSIPAGPNARMVYTAIVQDETWTQTGAYTPDTGEARQIFEMTLKRVGGTDWPSANPVMPELQ